MLRPVEYQQDVKTERLEPRGRIVPAPMYEPTFTNIGGMQTTPGAT